jgi:GT2 family glycosyltransferase
LETQADVLYSDEDHLSLQGEHCFPFRKPDWSPDLLYSQMYVCHFTTVKKSLFDELGGFCSDYDGSQDYDLMLRLSEKTQNIVHIPVVLYTWRECETSTAANADAKPYAHDAGRRALDAHLKRKYGGGARADDGAYTFVFDARFALPEQKPMVSVIIPMKDHCQTTDRCIESILSKTTYENYEILILDNRSEKAETKKWFEEIQKRDQRIRLLDADMEFNWSKLNNFGIRHAKGDVFILLNNDTEIITPDWMERMVENAVRPDIGVVGALLLYEDNTIQHAGVVIGMNGMADHVFKEMTPDHMGSPFVSPMVSRNVLAVTGACMAISRETIEKIGPFDESFIICGSDVEICIRAYEHGYNNKYDVNVRLDHLESKSRDSYIPPEDFKYSNIVYQPYFESGDPYFNDNLNLFSLKPQESAVDMSLVRVKNLLKRFAPARALWRMIKKHIAPSVETHIPEIGAINARVDSKDNGALRLNLITPSVDTAHVFGGISTALKLFEGLCKELGCEARIITTDAPVIESSSVLSKDYAIVPSEKDSDSKLQVISFNDRVGKSIPVRSRDVFMATAWWTAYTAREVIDWQKEQFGGQMPLLYMVQDYEPGFYPWSSRYMMADSTYRFDIPTYAVINSGILKDFFDRNDYHFDKVWSFEPVLNDKLAAFLPKDEEVIKKKKEILVYGRPSVDRNAFALVVESLKLWAKTMPDAKEWTVYSAGESHNPVDLGEGCVLQSLGKLSLEGYANQMLDTYAGLSLMVSPHPSYPPLELSTFGVKTITNRYANKDLSGFNDNLITVANCSPRVIAAELCKICQSYAGEGRAAANTTYAKGGKPFGDVIEQLGEQLKAELALSGED